MAQELYKKTILQELLSTEPVEQNLFQNVYGLQDEINFLRDKIVSRSIIRSSEQHKSEHENSSTNLDLPILLCGHPGTGKTFLLRAAANEAGVRLLVFNLYLLGSLTFRDPESSIKTVFEVAQTNSPCILCLEDIDCLCKEKKEFRQTVLKTLGKELDFIRTKQENRCVVIGITQKPWLVEPSLLSFFECRLIPLLDFQGRFELLTSMCPPSNDLTSADFETLAQTTEGMTGADLNVLIQSAAIAKVRLLTTAEYFKKVKVKVAVKDQEKTLQATTSGTKEGDISNLDTINEKLRVNEEIVCSPAATLDEKWAPCKSSDEGAVKMSWTDLDSDMIYQQYEVTKDNLFAEIKLSKPSISEKEEEKMQLFFVHCKQSVPL